MDQEVTPTKTSENSFSQRPGSMQQKEILLTTATLYKPISEALGAGVLALVLTRFAMDFPPTGIVEIGLLAYIGMSVERSYQTGKRTFARIKSKRKH